jgi:hypothetical protein
MKLVHQGSWTGAAAPNACRSMLAEKLPFDTRSGLFLLLYQGTTFSRAEKTWREASSLLPQALGAARNERSPAPRSQYLGTVTPRAFRVPVVRFFPRTRPFRLLFRICQELVLRTEVMTPHNMRLTSQNTPTKLA